MLSYGLPLLGLLALAVLVAGADVATAARGRWWPRFAVVAAYGAFGFGWLGGAARRCTTATGPGSARNRPASYWMWGNLAALTFSAGPMLWRGVRRRSDAGPPTCGLDAARGDPLARGRGGR